MDAAPAYTNMYNFKRMKVYGLTGGIACGKSTVAAMFKELGAAIVDADVVARQVVAPQTEGLKAVIECFGEAYLTTNGTLDREQLATLVFSDESARKKLNAITHPRIAAETMKQFSQLSKEEPFVIYDAALIVENNLHKGMAGLIVVTVPHAIQVERLTKRDALARNDAESRIAAQLPVQEKEAAADWLIDNSGPLDVTRAQVSKVHSELVNLSFDSRESGDATHSNE